MKKIISVILLSALLVLSLFNLSGCYNVRSGKMKRVQGTYELTGYSTDKDEIEARGIKLYVVIRSDGTGYYAYEDKDTDRYFVIFNENEYPNISNWINLQKSRGSYVEEFVVESSEYDFRGYKGTKAYVIVVNKNPF